MKITFLGAAHEVTGSCTLIEVGEKKGLVDCGMEQGKDLFVNQELPVNPADIDFVLLTHAHIDHSGNLPLLYKKGFRGTVYASAATCALCNIMLMDCAHIQMSEAEWKSRKSVRNGGPEIEPLYDIEDAQALLGRMRPCGYGTAVQVNESVSIRFTDVGHLLGSAAIEVWLTEGGETRKITFSGDLGNLDQPILKDPQPVGDTEYLVIESTYGDRLHDKGRVDYVPALAERIQRTLDRGGNVIIPSFAVGRTQEMLYFIREIKEHGLLPEYSDFEVYLDSPLAIEATKVFTKNMRECFDEEAIKLVDEGINPLVFPGLKTSVTSDDSKLINFIEKPKVIISASGMCDAGRIRHHLKHNLWRKECTILFVGYQANGTLGRRLLEGEKNIKLFGEPIEVHARIESLHGISGHADMNGLIAWLKGFKTPLQHVFVVHGEDTVTEEFAQKVEETLGCPTWAPFPNGEVDLAANEILNEGVRIAVKGKKPSQKKADAAFERLIAAGRRLLDVIYRREGIPNKDKAKFESQINNLADKWDRWE